MPAALQDWLARRRIMLSLIGFTSLITFNVCIQQTVPYNPFAVTEPTVILAIALLVVGVGIRSWSAGTLKKSRSLTTVGPYAMVRNPLYVGSFLMMFGFCLLCRDWPTLAFVVGPLSFLYWLQVRVEECRLAQLFPTEWPNYMQQTPRFLPYRFSRRLLCGWSLSEWLCNREYRALTATAVGIVAIFAWYMARGG